MGLGDMVNKGKEALGNEEQTDSALDKGADFAKDKAGDHGDKVDSARDAIDGKVGDE